MDSLSQSSPREVRRGVYTRQELGPNGEAILVAIDSRGRRLFEAPVYRPGTEELIAEALWIMLDASDPVEAPQPARPRLRVI